jgi:hypothetical protein
VVGRPGLVIEVSQNKYLAVGDDEMHAIVTVTSHDLTHGRSSARSAAEVIAIDCSGSMRVPPTKIDAARRATMAALDAMPDGVHFAIVAGTETATVVYPADPPPAPALALASPESRHAAKRAVHRLDASGGTAMGHWLERANELLSGHPDAVRHLILLTDGMDLDDYRPVLDRALAECEGRFVCDGRGIGDDYAPDDLQRIVSTLRGSADAIVQETDLVAEFEVMMRAAMAKTAPDVRLLVQTMPFAEIRFVKQVFPTEIDLTSYGTVHDARTTAYSTGSWGNDETREFHVCIGIDWRRMLDPAAPVEPAGSPRPPVTLGRDDDADVQAAVVAVATAAADAAGHQPQPVIVRPTHDDTLSSVIDPRVAHYAGYADLAEAVRAGCAAHAAEDLGEAARQWGQALALAIDLRHERLVARLGRLVDIDRDGVAHLKPDLRPRVVYSAVLASYTTNVSPQQPPPAPDAAMRACPRCHTRCSATARFCEGCGHPFGAGA